MTQQQFQIIAHSLGVDTQKNKLPNEYYRNRFCAGEGHHDMPTLKQLQDLGYMQDGGPREILGGSSMWWVTDAGLSAFKSEFEGRKKTVKMTRSQLRYQQYLNADSGLGFKEWLQQKR